MGFFDIELAKELLCLSQTREGCLLSEAPETIGRLNEQVKCILHAIDAIKPTHVLEIGTCAAHFPYLITLHDPSISITTIDISPHGGEAVDLLVRRTGAKVTFILGNSLEVVSILPKHYFDLAWVDGGHNTETCLGDLSNCANLGIKHILVDDYRLLDSVREGVRLFLRKFDYVLRDMSDRIDNRGIIYLHAMS